MTSDFIIKGINEKDFPDLFNSVLNLMKKFGINEIIIKIKPNYLNAAVRGKTIIVGKPLIDLLKTEEIEGIIAHEFSHIHLLHTLTSFFLSLFFLTPLIYSWITFNPKDIISVFFVFISILILIYGYRVRNWITLHQEINADILAVYHTKNPKALQNALIKLELKELSTKRHPLFSILNAILWGISYIFGFTHPELMKRIQYLELTSKIADVE